MTGAQEQWKNKQPVSQKHAFTVFRLSCSVLLLATFANMVPCDAVAPLRECSDGGADCIKEAEAADVLLARQLTISKASSEMSTEGAVVAADMEHVFQGLATRSAEGLEDVPQATLAILTSVDAEMDTIIANAATITETLQTSVNRAATDITDCNADAGNISTLTGTVSSKRSTHSTCRAQEKIDKAGKTLKCADLESYRTNLQAPSCLTCGSSGVTGFENENMECLHEMGSWYATTNSTWTSKKALCDSFIADHIRTQGTCNTDQAALESVFCIYEEALTLICNAQTTCRSNKISERNTTHADARVSEASSKSEMVSATKVKCFINVLRADTSQTAMMSNCIALTPNTSHLDVTYPLIPSAASCDLSLVATKPCDSAWKTAEYENKDWYNDAPPQTCTPCTPPTTTATTTTTEGVPVGFLDINTLIDPDLKGFRGGFSHAGYGYLVPSGWYSGGYLKSGKVARIDLDTFSGVQILDLTLTDPGLKGFRYGFHDGTYGYMVPCENQDVGQPRNYNGKVGRFKLDTFDGVQTLDLAETDSDLKGFEGGFSDGTYGYVIPRWNGGTFSRSKVARWKLDSFDNVQVLDLAATIGQDGGFRCGFHDGTFGYAVPYQASGSGVNSFRGKVARWRLDSFDGVEVLDLTATDPDLKGFSSGFQDGTYGYLTMPYERSPGRIVRFKLDTFDQVQVLDLSLTDPLLRGYNAGFAVGEFGYLIPYSNGQQQHGKVVRFKLASFDEVTVLDLESTDAGLKGFMGGFTDGVYGYGVPYLSGKVARFNLQTWSPTQQLTWD